MRVNCWRVSQELTGEIDKADKADKAYRKNRSAEIRSQQVVAMASEEVQVDPTRPSSIVITHTSLIFSRFVSALFLNV